MANSFLLTMTGSAHSTAAIQPRILWSKWMALVASRPFLEMSAAFPNAIAHVIG
jgi:hypothetical protein